LTTLPSRFFILNTDLFLVLSISDTPIQFAVQIQSIS
jgi:hypothetical protein